MAGQLNGTAAPAWPEPENLFERKVIIPEMQEWMLPDSTRSFIANITGQMRVPLIMPAIAVTIPLASMIGHKLVIQPLQRNS